jgi:hypothetical protein
MMKKLFALYLITAHKTSTMKNTWVYNITFSFSLYLV